MMSLEWMKEVNDRAVAQSQAVALPVCGDHETVTRTMERLDAEENWATFELQDKVEKNVRSGLNKLTRDELTALRLFTGV